MCGMLTRSLTSHLFRVYYYPDSENLVRSHHPTRHLPQMRRVEPCNLWSSDETGLKIPTDGKGNTPVEAYRFGREEASTGTRAMFTRDRDGGRGGPTSGGGYQAKMTMKLNVAMNAAGGRGPLVMEVTNLVRACVCACVRACVRACVCVCVRACVHARA